MLLGDNDRALTDYMVDKYYQAPPITQESEYINFLNDVNEKENVDLLIPASDAEAVLLSKYSNQVKTKFFLADYETVALFKDKLKATQELMKNNIKEESLCQFKMVLQQQLN